MAALAVETPRLSVVDRPRSASPAPEPEPEPFAWPKGDRLPLQKKVSLLANRGLWPEMERLGKQHGWHSEEVARFIDGNLPKADCPICGTPFYAYSRRVKYCGDSCRRKAAAANERRDPGAAVEARSTPPASQPAPPPKPAPKRDDLCVWLRRDAPDLSDRRYYGLLVAQDLFGGTALVRLWGRDGSASPQSVVTDYDTLDAAMTWLAYYVAQQEKRGYRRTPLAPGKGDLLRRAYEAAGAGVRP